MIKSTTVTSKTSKKIHKVDPTLNNSNKQLLPSGSKVWRMNRLSTRNRFTYHQSLQRRQQALTTLSSPYSPMSINRMTGIHNHRMTGIQCQVQHGN